MLQPEEARGIIEGRIAELAFPAAPAGLYEPIAYSLSSGGKRLRPVLALLAANMFNDEVTAAINPALGIEIFHNFTLLHDDLMDNSSIRRGNPTVHVKWNPDVAILSGDAMSMIAYRYLSGCRNDILGTILDIFNRTAVEVCEGQMMDMEFEQRNDVSEAEYLRMIELKTSVLIAASLQIGAVAGGALPGDAALMYDIGRNRGLAFQLQDDFLDTWGDPSVFGKKVGNDIITNKKTFLVISALKLAGKDDRSTLIELYSQAGNDPLAKVAAVKDIFERCGIKQMVKGKILDYFNHALSGLKALRIAPERKEIIETFSRSLMDRNF